MSQSQHTPGPWEIFKINNPKINPEIWSKYKRIAIITDTVETARLIAAAPDMLEQFKYILKIATDAIPEEYSGLIKAACNKIIAKAEGVK